MTAQPDPPFTDEELAAARERITERDRWAAWNAASQRQVAEFAESVNRALASLAAAVEAAEARQRRLDAAEQYLRNTTPTCPHCGRTSHGFACDGLRGVSR